MNNIFEKPAYQKMLENNQSIADRMAKLYEKPAYQKMIENSQSIADRMAKLYEKPAYQKMIENSQSVADRMAKLYEKPAYQKMLENNQSIADRMAKLLDEPSYLKAIERSTSYTDEITKLYDKPAYIEALQKLQEPLENYVVSNNFLDPSNLILNAEFSPKDVNDNSKEIQDSIIEQTQLFAANASKVGFEKALEKQEPKFKILMIHILINWIKPFLLSLSAGAFLILLVKLSEGTPETRKTRVEKIQSLPKDIGFHIEENQRFISGDTVNLRSEATSDSESLYELSLGELVTETANENYWVQVEYINDNGEIIHGWVYKRYVKKFELPPL